MSAALKENSEVPNFKFQKKLNPDREQIQDEAFFFINTNKVALKIQNKKNRQ